MHASDLLTAFLGRHLLPALFSSAVLLVALELLFTVGRLRRPTHRVWFLYAALLKGLMAVWVGEGISCLQARPPLAGYIAIQVPGAFAPDGFALESLSVAQTVATSDLALRVLLVVIVFLAAFFCYRWFRLAPLFRRLQEGELTDSAQFPDLHAAFRDLADRAWRGVFWCPRPRLLVIRGGSCFAFTMGIRPPVVVVSAEVAKQLGGPELRGILAHELAHVRRLDYLGRWVASILRDLMAWNPAAHRWYRRLLVEQEKASDERAAALLDDPAAVASGLVELAAYAGKVPLTSVGPLAAWRAGAKARLLEARLAHLEWVSLHTRPSSGWRAFTLVSVLLLLIAFLLAQPHVVVPVNRLVVPFRDASGVPPQHSRRSARPVPSVDSRSLPAVHFAGTTRPGRVAHGGRAVLICHGRVASGMGKRTSSGSPSAAAPGALSG